MEPIPELARLRGLGAPVTVLGRQRIGGVDTVHYRGTYSVARIMAPEPEPKPAVQELLRYLDGTTADVWLDVDGRIRRAVVAGQPGVDVRYDLSDFGVQVPVTPPPADDTEIRGP